MITPTTARPPFPSTSCDTPGDWFDFTRADGSRCASISFPMQNSQYPHLEDDTYVEITLYPPATRPLVWASTTRPMSDRKQLNLTCRTATWNEALALAESYLKDARAFCEGPEPDMPGIGRAWGA